MRKWSLTLLMLLLAARLAAAETAPRNVILIGWDGAQRAHVQECLARGELPNLQRLASEGAMVDLDVITGATDTKAGWTQILTGYDPQITGVYSNSRFRDVPAGYSVFERLKKQFGPDFVTAAVIGKRQHCGEIREPFRRPAPAAASPASPDAAGPVVADPAPAATARPRRQAGAQPAARQRGAARALPRQPGAGNATGIRLVEEDGVTYQVFDGSPYYTMHKSCDVWEYGLMQDEKVGTRANELLEQYKERPFFFFVHFAEVDHSGHQHGENSQEYTDALISNDAWTGRIVDKLKELGLYDRTLVYVTADHGFNEGQTGHGYAPYVFLATNDAGVQRRGTRADVAPTVLDRFGLDLSGIDPALSGEPLTRPATRPVPTAPARRAASGAALGANR